MSTIKGRVGKWAFQWKTIPRGAAGVAQVTVGQGKEEKSLEVRYRRDADGIWIELPTGVFGFDFDGQMDDEGSMSFRVAQRGANGEWEGATFLRAGEQSLVAGAGAVKKGVRVKAQMPGKIIRILAKAGSNVEKDQPLAVMEAMKMENEIRAPQGGKLGKVSVSEGQAIETGVELFVIDPV